MNSRFKYLTTLMATSACVAFVSTAMAQDFNIPRGDLKAALDAYSAQTGSEIMYASSAIKGAMTDGVKGNLSSGAALSQLLKGTGFVVRRDPSGAIGIDRANQSAVDTAPMQLAQAAPQARAVETVTVTSSKLGGADVQSIPISITALSQEQLTASQINGGPDLIKSVPNMTFTKTNFSGYSIQIRGIGTQAISVTTDPAVAVALNDIPFIRNHFFEQEFYDLAQVEVLRGPQGTLYGRNATAGVVNLTTAKPTDQFEAMASGELGNYHQRRFEGMINLPLVDDRLDLRIAGEWTKRQGYSFNALTDSRIDGRDLWSGRVTIGWKPIKKLQTYFVWEHFQEDDDRMRSAKQLCKTDPTPLEIGGRAVPQNTGGYQGITSFVSQGCEAASLYSPESFEVPNGFALPYFAPLAGITCGQGGCPFNTSLNPYASTVQSQNLRVIETSLQPVYKVKNDLIEFNADYAVMPSLTFTSQTGFNSDYLWQTEDYNRFNTQPGVFAPTTRDGAGVIVDPNGVFCDPQLGCSNRLILQDLVKGKSWQLNQEFRLASKFDGPLNFSLGGNYMHYEVDENYYVFVNSLSIVAAQGVSGDLPQQSHPYVPGVSDNRECLFRGKVQGDPTKNGSLLNCIYMDPNPLESLNDKGHNYFLSQNPYVLNSYAVFGETYYDLSSNLKLTGGLRWTEDRKHAPQIPSELLVANTYGYPALSPIDQQWDKITGRFAANWSPKLSFSDQTLLYGSYAHGYKAGGANPPPPVLAAAGSGTIPSFSHPNTFAPEVVDAFEVGTKNTFLDNTLTLNASAFYYDYRGYQISYIVDRTSVNLNFDAKVKGVEVEGNWEPVPGLRFNFAGGWQNSEIAKGERAIDMIDRTAGNPDFMVLKPFPTVPSNCIIPIALFVRGWGTGTDCGLIYNPTNIANDIDPGTGLPYTPGPNLAGAPRIPPGSGGGTLGPVPADYPGYSPSMFNNGEGFAKDLGGNELPNAPPLTLSIGAQYSMPLTSEWAGTLRTDYYWQDYSWARVFNDHPYDRLRGYTNVNLALILTSQNGWQVMLYDKNIFNTTAITGTFLNSDDSGLTTNVFLTDPKLIGIRVTKNW